MRNFVKHGSKILLFCVLLYGCDLHDHTRQKQRIVYDLGSEIQKIIRDSILAHHSDVIACYIRPTGIEDLDIVFYIGKIDKINIYDSERYLIEHTNAFLKVDSIYIPSYFYEERRFIMNYGWRNEGGCIRENMSVAALFLKYRNGRYCIKDFVDLSKCRI